MRGTILSFGFQKKHTGPHNFLFWKICYQPEQVCLSALQPAYLQNKMNLLATALLILKMNSVSSEWANPNWSNIGGCKTKVC
jgi:hypothetical protein